MKSTIDPALPSAPSSINTMTRLLAFRSSARLGHSLRFIVRDGGTNANGVIPTNGLIIQNARAFCRGITGCIKLRFPDVGYGQSFGVGENRSKDFVRVGVQESLHDF
jgi:hypothetical protein